MNDAVHDSPLGKSAHYPDRYDPGLLFPIPRSANRAALGIGAALPFHGVDIWNAYELSWLDRHGKPAVALAEFRIPAASPNIVESKSFKLYLNGFNGERIDGIDALRDILLRDLSGGGRGGGGGGGRPPPPPPPAPPPPGGRAAVNLMSPRQAAQQTLLELDGESIDGLAIDIDDYGPPNPAHLALAADAGAVEESLVSDLLKSNCPVTGQPDWASVQIRYAGPRIDRAGLLRYLISFRDHAEFHEHCVERIFTDLTQRCAPARLSVYARYTRRGGLDINPWRGSTDATPPNPRTARQ